VRLIFIFDPQRNAVVLVAGDKCGQWTTWYPQAVKTAEQAYVAYLGGKAGR
jgi:hypothetical protein